ncbi:hypothetical protein AB0D38_44440, partial [Streptomyces sp. NPDC048279]|uniref:hypothetical protein n=1 Tax=Streptomyces sp. NPDC048279 TaxID=3154714 RepID=UPI003426728C
GAAARAGGHRLHHHGAVQRAGHGRAGLLLRGATLRTTAGAAQTLAQPARNRDADAERDALEEFEAAVERARRESDTASHERPAPPSETNPSHHQIHLPEGAEQ